MLHQKLTTNPSPLLNKLGHVTGILLSALTTLTLVIALSTPPLSGPLCTGGCIEYPYSQIASRFPRDYIWMYPAILLTVIYTVFMVCIAHTALEERRVFGQLGVAFSLMAATTLILDYFVQLSVVQPSLLNGETEGIALITQYNSHGVFIALEELGFLFMSLSFLFMAMVYQQKQKAERALRLTFIIGVAAAVLSLSVITLVFGLQREYYFEIAIITINWLVLIVAGILQSRLFKKVW